METLSVTVSVLALMISAITAWLTLFRHGTVKMTQPTVIFFGPDVPRSPTEPSLPKIFLRTLLFSTSKRGRIIQNMYVSLARDDSVQNFNIWVYGEREKLVRGSGLFVGETGIAANHHFLIPREGVSFHFTEGRYRLDVYAHLLGDRARTTLFSRTLEITGDTAALLKEAGAGVYFDWWPDSSCYLTHVEKQTPNPHPEQFLELLGLK